MQRDQGKGTNSSSNALSVPCFSSGALPNIGNPDVSPICWKPHLRKGYVVLDSTVVYLTEPHRLLGGGKRPPANGPEGDGVMRG